MERTSDTIAKVGMKKMLNNRVYLKFLFRTGLLTLLPLWAGGLAISFAQPPPEPANLDQPTRLQPGDPSPVKATVPPVEPAQTAPQAPPAQPLYLVRPEPPGPYYVWASGYWWWTGGGYVWVPGYWSEPPYFGFHYVPGYWHWYGATWVYVRGGWARPHSSVIVYYPRPRPVVSVRVVPAPPRIARRHPQWSQYPQRRTYYRPASPGPRRLPPGGVYPRQPYSRPSPPPRRIDPSRQPRPQGRGHGGPSRR